jgi:hypothetical protein
VPEKYAKIHAKFVKINHFFTKNLFFMDLGLHFEVAWSILIASKYRMN